MDSVLCMVGYTLTHKKIIEGFPSQMRTELRILGEVGKNQEEYLINKPSSIAAATTPVLENSRLRQKKKASRLRTRSPNTIQKQKAFKRQKRSTMGTGHPLGGLSKPSGLRLTEKRNLEDNVSTNTVRQVSKKESIFAASLLKLRTILISLQENDQLM